MLVSGIIRYLRVKVDQIAIGGNLDTKSLGKYSVGYEIATLPTMEVVVPMTQALFPNFSRLASHPDLLKSAFLKAIGTTALFTAAIGAGLASVAELFVLVVLGEKWAPITPIVQWLALFGMLGSLNATYMPLLTSLGKTRSLAGLDILLLAIVAPIIFFAASYQDTEFVAAARVFSLLLVMPIIFYLVSRHVNVNFFELIAVIWRPFASAIVMSSVLLAMGPPAFSSDFFNLLIQVTLGAAIYLAMQLFLCWISGYKSTIEYDVFVAVRGRLRKSGQ